MTLLAAALALIGLALIWRGRRLRAATGLPWRRVAYQDTRQRTPGQPLFSRRHGLAGQPDYVLASGRAFIPVEVKPTRRDQAPRRGDVLQLAAYCLLLEEATGVAPSHGLLRYESATFEIDWTDALCADLLETLEAMRADLAAGDAPRSHDEPRRCRACGFADRCEDSLWTN